MISREWIPVDYELIIEFIEIGTIPLGLFTKIYQLSNFPGYN